MAITMEGEQTDRPTRIAALIVATLANFMTPFMGSAVNIALPAIGADFAADAIMLGWIPTAFLLAAAMFAVPFGRIADIFGLGILLFTLSSLLCALSPSAGSLILFRIFQGIASGMIFVTGLAIITAIYPAYQRGRAIGINIATVYVALALGPVLGGIMTQELGWRSLFWAMLPLGVAILAITLWKLKGEWAESRGERFDLAGSLIYSVVLVLVMYGFSILPSRTGAVLVLTGLIGLAGFLFFEHRVKSPVLNVRLFGNPTFALANLAALINFSATFAIAFLLSLYLQYIKGLSPRSAGLVLVAQPIVMAVSATVSGRLADRIEPRKLAALGMALSTAGLIIFAGLTLETPLHTITAGLVVMGLGFGLFSPPNTSAIMGAVERKFYGIASAMVSTMRLLGQMLSMGLALMVFALVMGSVRITVDQCPALLRSIRIIFTLCTVLCFSGIFVSLIRGDRRRRP
jgi:EmrB/QacA subfamily drug resistance transporter